MSFKGFDSEQIQTLASDLRLRGEDAPSLHNDLFNLLLTAQGHMGDKPVTENADLEAVITSGFIAGGTGGLFGYGALPGSLSEFTDTADEMDRRRAQLDACNELADDGYPIDASMVFTGEDPPSADDIDDAYEALAGAGDWDEGNDGNRDEIREVANALSGLTAAELDAVISKATPEELENLNALLTAKDDVLWYEWGVPLAERQQIVGDMLSRVSQDNLGKLTDAFPWAQPGFESTDAFLDGQNPQTGEQADGMRWDQPTDPLFAPNGDGEDVSYEDINQGRFGDCWYIASLIAVTQRDPEFIREGIRENPNGTVSVRIWDQDGNERWVTVTADLPMDENGNPMGAYGDGDTWPAYYEKAFALVYGDDDGGAPDGKEGDDAYDRAEQGSYGAIEWDNSDQAVPYITGNDTESADGLFTGTYEGTVEAWNSGHPVTVSTPPEAENVPADWEGSYSTRHVYYVIGVDDQTGEIILGNPWGSDIDPIRASQEEFEEFFEDPQQITIPE
jgi:hypothetical protein